MKRSIQRHQLNSKAALNTILVESQPFYYFGGNEAIIPYGSDNLYPDRIVKASQYSPTIGGCLGRLSYFIKGYGFIGGNFVVNREGETLNDILSQAVLDYSRFESFALHFNFNLIGQIAEIFSVPIRYLRKTRDLNAVEMGIWDVNDALYGYVHNITFELYGKHNPVKSMLYGQYQTYKGQIMYYSKHGQIYPDSPIQKCIMSGDYEREVQLYSYSTVKNSFSANNVIKVPTMPTAPTDDVEVRDDQYYQKYYNEHQRGHSTEVQSLSQELSRLHGAGNAGNSVVVPMIVDDEGKVSDFKMVESLAPTNVDSLFVNQNASAERAILKTFGMPEILLGVSSSGMFNESSYNDAFNYKNADTEQDRKEIERVFDKVMRDSIWDLEATEITPLKMKRTVSRSYSQRETSL